MTAGGKPDQGFDLVEIAAFLRRCAERNAVRLRSFLPGPGHFDGGSCA